MFYVYGIPSICREYERVGGVLSPLDAQLISWTWLQRMTSAPCSVYASQQHAPPCGGQNTSRCNFKALVPWLLQIRAQYFYSPLHALPSCILWVTLGKVLILSVQMNRNMLRKLKPWTRVMKRSSIRDKPGTLGVWIAPWSTYRTQHLLWSSINTLTEVKAWSC